MHTLRCFGRVGVEGPQGQPVRLRSRKHLALLVYLVTNPERDHPRDRLASLFWETDRSQARHSLSQALYDIRSHLPEARVDASVNHVAVEASSVDSEAARFESAIRTSDVRQAVDLYRGPFAPDLETVSTPAFERWVEDERSRLQRLAELVFCRYVAECDDRARWGELCTVALRLLGMNPLNEEAHRAFMRGMWLQGDQQSALDHYQQVEASLAQELPAGISPETQRLVERIRSSRPDVRPREPGRPPKPRMVGRRAEFARLKSALTALEDGEGGVFVLRGEAGIGKTRLLEEVRDVARLRGIRLLESRGFAAEADVAYGPIVEGLQPVAQEYAESESVRPTFYQLGVLFPDHMCAPRSSDADGLEADAGRRRLYEETALLLGKACSKSPRAWIVEDLHWIDASSAALLHYVARRLSDRPLLLLVSARSGEKIGDGPATLLEAWCGGGEASCLQLEGLSDDEIDELVHQVKPEGLSDATLATIRRLAGGNPFFALEMVSSARELDAWEPAQASSRRLLTESLRSLLGVRLKGLDLEAVRVLETIAILERHARPFLVARTSSMSTSRVAEIGRTLYARGLLYDDEGRLEFPHDITREYVYANMGELQRAALHLVAGEVLAGSEEPVSPSTLAHHFERGGDRARAYEYAIRAAEQSANAYAHDEAIDLATLALRQTATARERAAALTILAESESATGSLSAAESHLKELIGLGVVSSEEEIGLKLKLARSQVEQSQPGLPDSLLDAIDADIARLDPALAAEHRVEALHWRLKAAMKRNDSTGAEKVVSSLRVAVDALQETGGRAKAVALFTIAGFELFTNSLFTALDRTEEALSLLPESDHELRLRVALLHTVVLTRNADWQRAERALDSALVNAKRLNDVRLILAALNNRACWALEQGRWVEVQAAYDRFTEYAQNVSSSLDVVSDIQVNMANSLFYQGQIRAAIKRYESLLEKVQETQSTSLELDVLASLGLAHAQIGNQRAALRYCTLLDSLSQEDLGSVQDRFKFHWLRAYSGLVDHSKVAVDWDAALAAEEQADRVAYLKLLWLRDLLTPLDSNELLPLASLGSSKAGHLLRSSGLLWFAYASRRWLQQASH